MLCNPIFICYKLSGRLDVTLIDQKKKTAYESDAKRINIRNDMHGVLGSVQEAL